MKMAKMSEAEKILLASRIHEEMGKLNKIWRNRDAAHEDEWRQLVLDWLNADGNTTRARLPKTLARYFVGWAAVKIEKT